MPAVPGADLVPCTSASTAVCSIRLWISRGSRGCAWCTWQCAYTCPSCSSPVLLHDSIPSGEPGSAAAAALAKRRSVRGVSVRRGSKAVASDGAKLRGVDIRMAAAFALREVGGKMPYKTARHNTRLPSCFPAWNVGYLEASREIGPCMAEPFAETVIATSWGWQQPQSTRVAYRLRQWPRLGR